MARATISTDAPEAPQDLDAERSVLAAMLLGAEAIGRARGLLAPGAFYRLTHDKIFTALLALHDRGEPADSVTLAAELRRRGDLDVVGGAATIAHILEYATTTANVVVHARIVAEAAWRRDAVSLLQDLIARVHDPTENVDEIWSQVRAVLTALDRRPRTDAERQRDRRQRQGDVYRQKNRERMRAARARQKGST